MKALVVIVVILAVIAFITKPSDQQCVTLIQEKMERTGIPQSTIKGQYTGPSALRFEDHYLYKTIYSNIDGHKVGVGLIGAVIMD